MSDFSYNMDLSDLKRIAERKKRRLKSCRKMAQIALCNVIIRDTDPFVPFDTGMTAGSVMDASDKENGLIIYDTPYARKIYYGDAIHFHKDHHALATARWFEHAKAENLETWLEVAKRAFAKDWSKS